MRHEQIILDFLKEPLSSEKLKLLPSLLTALHEDTCLCKVV